MECYIMVQKVSSFKTFASVCIGPEGQLNLLVMPVRWYCVTKHEDNQFQIANKDKVYVSIFVVGMRTIAFCVKLCVGNRNPQQTWIFNSPSEWWNNSKKWATRNVGHVSIRITVRSWYIAVIFLQITHERHPIARPWGRGMGYRSWMQGLIKIVRL